MQKSKSQQSGEVRYCSEGHGYVHEPQCFEQSGNRKIGKLVKYT
jgi:hypothetical protein